MASSIVWLASYPKSGNTWLRLLLANLLSNEADAVDINDIDLPHRHVVARSGFDEHFLIDTSLLTREELDEMRPLLVGEVAGSAKGDIYVKMHDAYRILESGEPLLGRGHARAALYMLRDPRDVAISWAHHCGTSIGKAIQEMNNPASSLGAKRKCYDSQVPQLLLDWSAHVGSWIEQTDVPVHVIRYEDLHDDPASALQAAADFLNLEVTPGKVQHAVNCTDFAALQRQEQGEGFCERPLKSASPFFRSGRFGGWREILTPEQQQAITRAHQRVMDRFGYI